MFLEYGLIGSVTSGAQGAVAAAWDALTRLSDDVQKFVRDNPAVALAVLALLVGIVLFPRRRR